MEGGVHWRPARMWSGQALASAAPSLRGAWMTRLGLVSTVSLLVGEPLASFFYFSCSTSPAVVLVHSSDSGGEPLSSFNLLVCCP